MSRMFERFANGQLATGTITLNHGLEIVEVLGYSGFDFICIDMMVTPLDWSEVAAMVLAAKRYNVTPWVRLSAYPWGDGEMDAGLPAQVMRAFGLGAECVLASVNTARQVEQLMHPMANAHRRFYIRQGGKNRTEVQRKLDEAEPELRVVPIIESSAAFEHIDEITAVPAASARAAGRAGHRHAGHGAALRYVPAHHRHPHPWNGTWHPPSREAPAA